MSNYLFENLYGSVSSDVLNIWATHKQQRRRPSLWFDLASTEGLERAEAEALALDAQGFDVYFGAGLVAEPIRERERLNKKTGGNHQGQELSRRGRGCNGLARVLPGHGHAGRPEEAREARPRGPRGSP